MFGEKRLTNICARDMEGLVLFGFFSRKNRCRAASRWLDEPGCERSLPLFVRINSMARPGAQKKQKTNFLKFD